MLKLGCPNILHIVFAASFIALPSKLAMAGKYVPFSLLKNSVIPKSWVGKLIFGRYATQPLIELFYQSIQSVENSVLSNRLIQIVMLPEPNVPITVPCSYIRPLNDNLVSKKAIEPFQRLCRRLSVHEVEGTHFVLQTNPVECWQIIQSANV